MKHVKIIGLLAVAAAVMMAFAANASAATRLTSPTGTEYGVGKTIKAEAGTTKLTGAFATVECAHSIVEGTISMSGGTAVKINLSTLDFETCNFKTVVKKAGTLELTGTTAGDEVKGTLRSTGAEVEVTTNLGTCVFATNSTDIGTFTGGNTALIDISGAIPRTAGNFLCGSSGNWEGTYEVVTPDELWLDAN